MSTSSSSVSSSKLPSVDELRVDAHLSSSFSDIHLGPGANAKNSGNRMDVVMSDNSCHVVGASMNAELSECESTIECILTFYVSFECATSLTPTFKHTRRRGDAQLPRTRDHGERQLRL
jgi:hypothetical protein